MLSGGAHVVNASVSVLVAHVVNTFPQTQSSSAAREALELDNSLNEKMLSFKLVN
jgi:hypothetical protein